MSEPKTGSVVKAAGTVLVVAVVARLGWELLRPMIGSLVLAVVVWSLYTHFRRGRRW